MGNPQRRGNGDERDKAGARAANGAKQVAGLLGGDPNPPGSSGGDADTQSVHGIEFKPDGGCKS